MMLIWETTLIFHAGLSDGAEALGTPHNGEQRRELVCPHSTAQHRGWVIGGPTTVARAVQE